MLILPRLNPSPCLLHRGMPTIFLRLGIFQPAKWGIFNRRKLGNFRPALTVRVVRGFISAAGGIRRGSRTPVQVRHLDR